LAMMGFIAACFVSVNDTVYPSVFLGPLAELNSVNPSSASIRAFLADAHLILGSLFLIGHIWHAYRARSAVKRGVEYRTVVNFLAEGTKVSSN
jgi:photosystem II CP43 chlorophyll apoprotein